MCFITSSCKSNFPSPETTKRAHFFLEASVFLKGGAESILVKFQMAEIT